MSENPPLLKPTLSSQYGLPIWFEKYFRLLVIEVFFLMALGAGVRVMNAGLACPDWPLCFGDIIPDYHPQVYLEFIHRALAGVVTIAAFTLNWYLWKSQAPKSLKWIGVGSLVLLVTQVVFGGLTVILQLHAKVVAAHLGLAAVFFSTILWMYLSLRPKEEAAVRVPGWMVKWSWFTGFAIFGQIILGGLVASHYAANVCTDFPTCNGAWFPTFSGVIGLHIIHRLGAYTVFAIALVNLFLMIKKSGSLRLRKIGIGNFAMVLTQVGIGIANVFLHTPPLIAVIHLAMAMAILSMAVRQIHFAKAHSI